MTLSSRLVLAFALVALVVVLAMAWTTSTLIRGLFFEYLDITRPWQASVLGGLVGRAYERAGWPGVRIVLNGLSEEKSKEEEDTPGRGGRRGPSAIQPPGARGGGPLAVHEINVPPLAIVDLSGRVRASTSNVRVGETLDARVLELGYPLRTEAGQFGTLVFNPGRHRETNLLMGILGPVLGRAVRGADSPEEAYRMAVTWGSWITAIFAVVLAALMGWLVSRHLGRPLARLAAGAHRFAGGDLKHRIHIEDPPETARVAETLNEMAEQISESRSRERQLFADIAHELRTPLTIMRGQLDELQDDAGIPGRTVLSLQDEILRLSRLVDDLGQLSLAELGNLPLKRKSVRSSELIRSVVVGFSPEARERDISLLFTFDEADEPEISADPVRIQQVIANLLGNALRYTPSGGQIRIQQKITGEKISISVADDGPGIPPEELPHIFDRFYRARRKEKRSDHSFGLGLAIARGYVRAHGGEISAESEPGRGTTITFTLPIFRGEEDSDS